MPSPTKVAVPCTITALRLAATPAVAALLAGGDTGAGLAVAGAVASGDLVDGAVARRLDAATRIGAWLDSAADRCLYLALVAGLVVNGSLSTPLVALLAAVLITQTLVAARFLLPAGRDARRPKTLTGAVLGGVVLATSLPLSPPVARVVELAVAVTAIDGLWWYWSQARSQRTIPALPSSWSRGPAPTGRSSRTRGVATLANLITFSRVGPAVVGLDAISRGQLGPALVCGAAFVGADILDGFIARALGQVSRLGAFLDRGIDAVTLVAVVLASSQQGWIEHWAAVGILARVAVITLLTTFLQVSGIRRPRSFCSAVANLGVLVALLHPTTLTIDVAVVVNLHNVLHVAYWTGQSVLRRIEARRVHP